MLIKRKPSYVPVAGVLVRNAGEMMLLWEAGRLQQIYYDYFKDIEKSGCGPWHPDGEGWEIALQRIRGQRAAWSRHAERLVYYANAYRAEINNGLPEDLDQIACHLETVDLDAAAIASGKAGSHDETVLYFAYLAGLHKAEIAVTVADASLSMLEQTPYKWFQDMKLQVEVMLAERVSKRMQLEDSVRKSLVRRRKAHHEADIKLRVSCTTLHDLPCAIWRPSIRSL